MKIKLSISNNPHIAGKTWIDNSYLFALLFFPTLIFMMFQIARIIPPINTNKITKKLGGGACI